MGRSNLLQAGSALRVIGHPLQKGQAVLQCYRGHMQHQRLVQGLQHTVPDRVCVALHLSGRDEYLAPIELREQMLQPAQVLQHR